VGKSLIIAKSMNLPCKFYCYRNYFLKKLEALLSCRHSYITSGEGLLKIVEDVQEVTAAAAAAVGIFPVSL
jgi:hypothetical protein